MGKQWESSEATLNPHSLHPLNYESLDLKLRFRDQAVPNADQDQRQAFLRRRRRFNASPRSGRWGAFGEVVWFISVRPVGRLWRLGRGDGRRTRSLKILGFDTRKFPRTGHPRIVPVPSLPGIGLSCAVRKSEAKSTSQPCRACGTLKFTMRHVMQSLDSGGRWSFLHWECGHAKMVPCCLVQLPGASI